jgi:hypothetical protein
MSALNDDAWLRLVSTTYFWAVSIAALATAVSIVAGIAQYRLSNSISAEKDRALEQYQSDAGIKIAAANEQAKEADKKAAEANKQAAKLDNETALLKAENLRLQAQLAWRTLNQPQQGAILKVLEGLPGRKVSILSVMGDAEGKTYASQFAERFRAGGWDITPNDISQGAFAGAPPVGIMVGVNPADDNDTDVVSSAEALVDVLFKLKIIDRRAAYHREDVPRGRVLLIVGVKPPLKEQH